MTSLELKKKKGKKKKKKERHPVQYKVQRIQMPTPTLCEVSHFHYIWAYVIHDGPGFVT